MGNFCSCSMKQQAPAYADHQSLTVEGNSGLPEKMATLHQRVHPALYSLYS